MGANRPEDAIYPLGYTDGQGKPMTGEKRYVIRLAKGQTPPVDGFWSVSMYDDKGLPVANPINRYAVGDRDKLKFNDDGSLTLHLQHEAPGADEEADWLPSPQGVFTLMIRCYAPRPPITSGEWLPPPVEQVR